MRDCRAAVITAHNQPIEIQRVPIPRLEQGALLVRIVASTLCGTDVHRWQSRLAKGDSLPIITGHEPCGIIEEIAGDRTDILGDPVRPGDRIVWSYVSCGSCYYCSVAMQSCMCINRASWGHHRLDQFPHLLGSCAEYMYVPPSCLLIKVPDEVSSASAAASACAYRTVMHGFDRLGAIKSHESVLIQGSGPLGSFACCDIGNDPEKAYNLIGLCHPVADSDGNVFNFAVGAANARFNITTAVALRPGCRDGLYSFQVLRQKKRADALRRRRKPLWVLSEDIKHPG